MFLNEINSKRLEEYLKSTSLSYKTRSNSYIFSCPRCYKEKLYIRRRDGVFVCWKCRESSGFKGRAEYALAELQGISVAEVREKLYDVIPINSEPSVYFNLNLNTFLEPEEELEEFIPPIHWPWHYYPIDDIKSVKGVEYLIGRGISLDVAVSYGLRYSPRRRRVAFPVNLDGQLVGYQERLIIDNKFWNKELEETITIPKILSSDDLPRDHLLLFAERITTNQVILAEGPIDALKLHLCPGQGNCASMGKAVSKGQIEYLLKANINKIYLALDPDALDEAARLVRNYFDGLDCYMILPPKGHKDIGELEMEHVVELYKSAPKVHKNTLFGFMT